MPVPVIFSTFPGGSSIPLADLDLNFSYLASAPAFTGNVSVGGNLTVAGTSNFTGAVTTTDLAVNGNFSIDGVTVNPTGFTGTGLLVLNNGPTLIAPVLGTPASGDLANCTNLPITSVNGLATGVLPFLTNPTTANLAAAVVDETGTGNLVLSNSPTLTSANLVAPVLGTPASGNLSACTGYPAPSLTGVVQIANGGTGMSTTGAVGEVLGVSAPGVLGYFSAPPSTNLAGGAASQIVYQAAPNTTAFVPNGTIGQPLVSNGVAPPAWGQISLTAAVTGALPIANGGTNSTTQQGALNNLAGSTATGLYLRGNGTNVLMSAIQAADVPVLNQNTTGFAAGFTSTTQNSQFNSIGVGIAPTGTAGEIVTTGHITTASRVTTAEGTLYPLVGIPNATVSGTTFTVTGIPAWAKRVTVFLRSITGAGDKFAIRLGTSGGIVTTGYVGGAWVYLAGAGNGSSALLTAGSGFSSYTGLVTITAVPGTSVYSINGQGQRSDGNSYTSNGYVTLPGLLTQFELLMTTAASFTGGNVAAIYE